MQRSGDSMSGQLHLPEAEVQRRLLAQISSRGLLKPGHRFDSSSLGAALSGQGTACSPRRQSPLTTQQQQQQQLHQQHLVAEMVSHLLHHLDAALSGFAELLDLVSSDSSALCVTDILWGCHQVS